MKRLITLAIFFLLAFPAVGGQCLIGPNAVYKQPASTIHDWMNRGVTVFIGWEEGLDTNGKPTVHLVDYLNTAQAAGAKVIVQLDAIEVIPWNHPAIAGFIQTDEPDNMIVNGATWVYDSLRTTYATAKANRPDLPVYENIDGWQFGWHKVDYAQLFACADYVGDDYYCDARNLSIDEWVTRQNVIKTAAGGKFAFTFVATSFQNLDPAYYAGERTPSAASVQRQFDEATKLGIATPLFPQSFSPFRYDSTPADVNATITAANAKVPPPQPVPSPIPIVIVPPPPTTQPYLPTFTVTWRAVGYPATTMVIVPSKQ